MKELPVTVRRAIELIGLYTCGLIIVAGSNILTPIIMAFFLSIMLMPLYSFLVRKKLPEALAIAISLIILLAVLGAIIWFFSSQIGILVDDFPKIKANVTTHLNALSEWINQKTNFSSARQTALIKEQSGKVLNSAGGMLGGAAASLSSIVIFVGLVPIYIFLILFYKNLLLRFMFLWFPAESHEKLKDGMLETKSIIKSYLVGLMIQITYITILLGGALMIIGIKHALLIGVIFAVLNLIPYVGALLGNVIGVLLTLSSSEELWPVWTVLITIAIVQFLDNNILMPRIVGSKVKINALASIVGVLVGGAVAGISGMFLSIPIIAILKIIFDRSNNLKQWGVLFGDERPKMSPMRFPAFRMKSRKVKEVIDEQNNIEPPKS
ncbi:AI-2E family transporter [Segetibacter sp. 3557_3]|nr:AI-2E family transporter [Segetibacter sp. 3557_3]